MPKRGKWLRVDELKSLHELIDGQPGPSRNGFKQNALKLWNFCVTLRLHLDQTLLAPEQFRSTSNQARDDRGWNS